MFGNTPISYEDNLSLEDVVRNQEQYDLNVLCFRPSGSDFFTKSLPFPDEKIDWIHDYKMRDKWDIHPDEE